MHRPHFGISKFEEKWTEMVKWLNQSWSIVRPIDRMTVRKMHSNKNLVFTLMIQSNASQKPAKCKYEFERERNTTKKQNKTTKNGEKKLTRKKKTQNWDLCLYCIFAHFSRLTMMYIRCIYLLILLVLFFFLFKCCILNAKKEMSLRKKINKIGVKRDKENQKA